MRALSVLGCILVGSCSFTCETKKAAAHDGANDAWYESLKQPNGIGCCSLVDCLPTEERIVGDHYEAVVAGKWLPVPPERVITDRGNPVGRPVVCARAGEILCFVPGARV